MNKINNKYDNNYNNELKRQSLILDQGETDDTKKKSKQLESYLTQITKLIKEKEEKQAQVQQKVDEKKETNNIGALLLGTKREKARFTVAQTTPNGNWVANDKTGWGTTWNSFIGATGATDPWRGSGWNNIITAHYPSSYKDNLYKIQNQTFSTTEEQAISLLARVIYELGKIDKSDLVDKHGLTGADKTNFENWYDHIKTQSDSIEALNKKGSDDLTIKTWDLPQTYSKEQSLGAATARSTALNFTYVFNFLEKLNDTLIGKLKQDNITKSETWKIAKQGEAYSEQELENYGIFLQDKSKTTLYKSTKQVGGRWIKEEHEIKINNGLKDWVESAKLIFADADNQNKIKASFNTSPNQYLLADLRSQSGVANPFTHNTHDYRLFESEDKLKELEDDLETKKITGCFRISQLEKEIAEGQKEIDAKQAEITTQETEIDKLVKEIIVAKREELKKHNITKGFAKTDAEDNRREYFTLFTIQNLLNEIRYLENNGNSTLPSTIQEENTAHDQLTTILNEAGPISTKTYLVRYFHDLAWVKDEKPNIQQAINRIKAGKHTRADGTEENITTFGDLATFKEHFETQEKLVKLTSWEQEAKTAIEQALNQEDNAKETLTDWQTKLKALDPALDENLITEPWKAKWGTINKHNKIADLEKLLKEIIGSDGKVKSEFLTEIQKSDATLVDLKTLLTKEPKEIITLIARFTYNQLDDSSEVEKDKQKTQQKRRIAKKLNKSKESELTEAELNESLYKIRVGEMTLDNKFYQADLSEITTEDSPQQENSNQPFHRLDNWKMWATYGIPAVGLILTAIFWKKLKSLWSDPAEEQGEEINQNEEKEDDEE